MSFFEIDGRRLNFRFNENGLLEKIEVDGAVCLNRQESFFAVCIDGKRYETSEFVFKGAARNKDNTILSYSLSERALDLSISFASSGPDLSASFDLRCGSDAQGILSYVELFLRELAFDGPDTDVFHSPGQGACHELTSRNINFKPGCRCSDLGGFTTEEDMFSTTPDKGAGLLCIEGSSGSALAMTAYSSEVNHFPMTEVSGSGITFIERNMTCFDMAVFGHVETGTSYFFAGTYPEILESYQDFLTSTLALSAPEIPAWFLDGYILEVHASQMGGFAKAEKMLDEFLELGVRTIYLMPCLEYRCNMIGGNYIHGFRESGAIYSIMDYHHIDELSGGEEAFRSFVSAAHSKGIRILFDLVPQGASVYGGLIEEHPEWFELDEKGLNFSSHGWSNTYSLDWSLDEVIDFFVEVGTFYLKNFDIDGFRIDAPHWKEPNMRKNIGHIASHACFGSVRLIDKLLRESRKIKSDVVLLCEVWGVIFQPVTHAQCEYNIHWALYNTATGVFTGRDLQTWMKEYMFTQLPGSGKVVFLETHDTELLTPLAERFRGSLVTRALMTIAVFCGCKPMIWYSELDDMKDFYSSLAKTTRKLDLGHDMVKTDYGIARVSDENVFAAFRNGQRKLLCVTNFNRQMVHAELFVDLESAGLDKNAEYELFDAVDDCVYSLHRSTVSGIETYSTFKGNALKEGLRLDVVPFVTHILEIRKVERI